MIFSAETPHIDTECRKVRKRARQKENRNNRSVYPNKQIPNANSRRCCNRFYSRYNLKAFTHFCVSFQSDGGNNNGKMKRRRRRQQSNATIQENTAKCFLQFL